MERTVWQMKYLYIRVRDTMVDDAKILQNFINKATKVT